MAAPSNSIFKASSDASVSGSYSGAPSALKPKFRN